jgi:sugar transferase (PEP-CTERM/EpsH1 system associated)
MKAPATGVPIRVLHVVSVLGHGGMEAGVMKLVTGCDPARVVADVCTLEPARAFKDMFTGDSQLHELSRKSALDLRLVRALAGIMRRRRIDVVHTHAWGTLVEGWMAARLAGVPYMVHGEHGTMETRPVNIRVQRWLWNRVDRLLAVSAELADRMVAGVGVSAQRIQVIPNGVDLTRYGQISRATARASLSIDPQAFITLSVGRLVRVKNYALLLEAARTLSGAACGWQFLVAGEGPLRAELEASIEHKDSGAVVRLLGHRTDIPLLLAAADAFVLTSWSEGMSNTILEAMAAGRPVVATQVGGNPQLVVDGFTGFLVPPHNAGGLRDALMALATDAALARRMGAAGRARVEEKFSRDRMTAQYTEMYESLIGRVQPGTAEGVVQPAASTTTSVRT